MPRTGFGMANGKVEPRLAAVLSYMFGIDSGIIILTVERDSRFVRFHALQSILFSAVVIVVLGALILAGLGLVSTLLGVGAWAVWVILMLRAARGEWWQLPGLGRWAERVA